MASNVIKVSVLADARQFKQAMGDTERSVQGIESKLGAFGKAAVAALAVKAVSAVKDFVGSSIRSFSDLNESLNALDVTYGEHSEGIKKLGEQAATALGLSNSEFNGYAVSVSAFAKQIAGESGDVVGTVETLSGRVSDFASVMNLEVGDAFGKFRSGLAGESEPLRQFGIDVSDAKIKQQALADGIWNGIGAMTEDQKVRARFNAIMEQTANTAGDFANTSDQAANKQRILTATMEDQKAALGEGLMPLYSKWQELQSNSMSTLDDIVTILGSFTSAMDEAGESSTGLFDILLNALAPGSADSVIGLIDEWAESTRDAEAETEKIAKQVENASGRTNNYSENIEIVNARLRAQTDATDDQVDAQEELNRETATGIELARAAHDANREATDALFGVKEATRRQAEAQAVVNELAKDGKTDTDEYIIALEDLSGANADVKSAQMNLIEQGGLTREEFVNQQISLGMLREDAERLAEVYNVLFTPRSVTHTITTRDLGTTTGRKPGKAAGGPVRGGSAYKVGERGPETFVPDSDGTIVPNGRMGDGGNVYITVNALDAAGAAKAVVEALQQYERRHGAVPITVRTR